MLDADTGAIIGFGTLARLTTNRLGVLAFGDSITNAGGEIQWGVAMHSWALWVARALGVPFTSFAFDGATVIDVLEHQIPAWHAKSAHPDASYDLGCLYIGVNDVRGLDWEPRSFERVHGEALSAIKSHCERVLAVTAPLDLGRPRAGAKVRDLNAIIARNAHAHGALLLDLENLKGRNLVMADHVHLTAFGQIALAERALETLERDGLAPRERPSRLISYETTRLGRLRGDLTYAYRHAKISARSALLKAAFALRPR